MDTPEEAKQKIREIAEEQKAKAEKERPRTYTERLQDMGRLPKGGGATPKSNRDITKNYKSGGTASSRADGCAKRGKTKGRMV